MINIEKFKYLVSSGMEKEKAYKECYSTDGIAKEELAEAINSLTIKLGLERPVKKIKKTKKK
jgi:hypothetical protein